MAVTVTLSLSADSGATYPYPCFATTGGIGVGMLPGTSSHIVWSAGAHRPGFASATCRLRVTADDGAIDPPAATIAQVRATPDGTGLNLFLSGVYVTAVKPPIAGSTDPFGFFIQDAPTGPALFVGVDAMTLSAAVGDQVSFRVTGLATVTGLREVTAIDGYDEVGSGFAVSTLLQDLTNSIDVVSALNDYESEYVSVTGSLGTPTAAGTGYV